MNNTQAILGDLIRAALTPVLEYLKYTWTLEIIQTALIVWAALGVQALLSRSSKGG